MIEKNFIAPIDPFSEYAFLCENDDYPKTDFTQFQFKGKVDTAALAQCYEEAMEEVPIFHSHLVHGKRGLLHQPYWVANYEQKNRLIIEDCRHFPEAAEPFDPMVFSTKFHEMRTRRRMDIEREFPFQCYLIRVADDRYIFSILYHHSCLDPAKVYVLLTKMFRTYHERVKGETPEWARAEGQKGLARTGQPVQCISLPRYAYEQFRDIYFAYPNKKVAHIASEKVLDYHREKGRHSLRSIIDDPKLIDGIGARARRHEATVNDILMAVCRKTIHQWNLEHGDRRDCYRMVLASSLKGRKSEKIDMSGTGIAGLNYVSDGQGSLDLDRLIEYCRDRRKEYLGQGYDIQMNYLINKIISAFRVFPFAVRTKLANAMIENTPSTFYVSNIGVMWPRMKNGRPTMDSELLGAGDFVIEDLHSSASITRFIGMGITCRTHNRRFYMNFVADKYRFRDHEMARIKERIVREFVAAIS